MISNLHCHVFNVLSDDVEIQRKGGSRKINHILYKDVKLLNISLQLSWIYKLPRVCGETFGFISLFCPVKAVILICLILLIYRLLQVERLQILQVEITFQSSSFLYGLKYVYYISMHIIHYVNVFVFTLLMNIKQALKDILC